MANRGRGFNQEWDPMRDDFDSSNYDPQYADDNNSDYVNLDHCRLYITNIPKGLNDEGLRSAFSKYGTLVEVYISRDPQKRYGLVSFETPGEAKLAMMKLNRTEPLKLQIHVAHKKRETRDRPPREQREWDRRGRSGDDSGTTKNRERSETSTRDRERTSRDDATSVTSRSRHVVKMANGDNNITTEDLPLDIEDEISPQNFEMDPELQIELERIQLERLRLQTAQLVCKQRMLLKQAEQRALSQNTPSSRCVLPGGKVVLRNVCEGSAEREMDTTYTAAAGDSPPGLQPAASRACLACGARAEAFCARCGVAPYCSAGCQRRDWAGRHRDVCHNLARLNKPMSSDDDIPAAVAVAPLRSPRGAEAKPQASAFASAPGLKYNQPRRDSDRADEDTGSEKRQNQRQNRTPTAMGRDGARAGPARENHYDNRSDNRADNRNAGRFDNRNANRNDNRGDNRNCSRDNRKTFNKQDSVSSDFKGKGSANQWQYQRRQQTATSSGSYQNDDEDWDRSPTEPTPEEKPQLAPAPLRAPKLVPETPKPATPAKPPAEVEDVTPTKRVVPKTYVLDTLSTGDTVLLSVEASEGAIFVCLAMHESLEGSYDALCGDYAAAMEKETRVIAPTPGTTFSYLDPSDGGWYRARCLSPTTAALLDCGRLVSLAGATCRPLPAAFEPTPEFCCVVSGADVKVGDSFQATLGAKSGGSIAASLSHIESGETAGTARLARWTPIVEYASPTVPKASPPTTQASLPVQTPPVQVQTPPLQVQTPPVQVPEVSRPDVVNNTTVLLVDCTAWDRAFVRLSDTASRQKFDGLLQDAVRAGMSASPLPAPPVRGATVLGRFTDGLHYRALVKRTNVKQDKYLLEYVEYGNIHISPLADLFACPPNLSLEAAPAVTSQVALRTAVKEAFTPPALEYLEKVKDEELELVMTLCDGQKSGPSGSEVALALASNRESFVKKLEGLCLPDWKKLEMSGGDVVATTPLMYHTLEYIPLPPGGCEVEVLDFSLLAAGTVSGCPRGHPHAKYVFGELTDKMAEYCNSALGRDPYLPVVEELCIAQCPPYPQWSRAVVAAADPGAPAADLCFVDYGNVEAVPVRLLRKMLPEFAAGVPAVALTMEIRGFPKEPTTAQLAKAVEVLQVNDEGRGVLRVSRCESEEAGSYVVDAPELIAAMERV